MSRPHFFASIPRLTATLCVPIVILISGGCTHYPDWTLVKEEDATSVFFRDTPNSNIPSFRGEVIIDGDFQDVMQVLTNFAKFDEWVYQCERIEVVDFVSYSEAYLYQVNSLPIIRDRDIIVHGTVTYDTVSAHTDTTHSTAQQRAIIALTSVPEYCDTSESMSCDEIKQSNYIRVRRSEGIFEVIELSDNRVKVSWQQSLEPGGWIPDWLTRMMISDVPIITLNNLKNLVEQVN
ncbi:hypothetical protein NBRC116494_14140 [Aurantivibrio plasticivorans]